MSKLSDPGTRLVIRRTFEAPRERVFRAWTDPRRLMQWMSPSDRMAIPSASTDLRVGGRYHIEMVDPDGPRHRVEGEYLEILPPKRLVFTWVWISTPERVSHVTVELAEEGPGRTSLTLTHDRFADSAVRDRHEQGWRGCVDRLARHLAVEAPQAKE